MARATMRWEAGEACRDCRCCCYFLLSLLFSLMCFHLHRDVVQHNGLIAESKRVDDVWCQTKQSYYFFFSCSFFLFFFYRVVNIIAADSRTPSRRAEKQSYRPSTPPISRKTFKTDSGSCWGHLHHRMTGSLLGRLRSVECAQLRCKSSCH